VNPDCYVKDSAVIDRRTASLIYYPRVVEGTVTLPEGIKRIEDTCMQYCSMEKLVLPDSLLEFEENAVIHCPKLREIVFGACRVTIVAEPDDRAPEDFPALESVVFDGTEHLSCTEIAFTGDKSEMYLPACGSASPGNRSSTARCIGRRRAAPSRRGRASSISAENSCPTPVRKA